MTALQNKMIANAALNAARLARLRMAVANAAPAGTEKVLADLRANKEGVDEDSDGTRWGVVYLANAGGGHSFAGSLAALKAAGLYRPMNDQHFGWVRMA